MIENSYIGVDIGGTKISIGKIRNNILESDITLETQANKPADQIVSDIISGIRKFIDKNVTGIGIGVPGLVDAGKGIVYNVQNIPSWDEVRLKYYIEKEFNIRVSVANDANCFALGEKTFGKGKDYENIAGLVLGTGLGTGLIINGQLYSGMFSLAGEFGGMPYLRHDYEYYCSGKFFKNNYKKSGEVFNELASRGDSKAAKVFREFGRHLGNMIKVVLYSVGPQAIFLGGSVSKSFEFFKDEMWRSVLEFPYKRITDNLVIEKSTLEKPGILGAASLVQNDDNPVYFKALNYEKN